MHLRPPISLLLGLLALVVCAIVNPGNFGTIDTFRRLQAERWIRLGEPPVRPIDVTEFGLTGRNGVVHPWYGVGQSLVLLPFDWVVSTTVTPRLEGFGLDSEKQHQVTDLLISFLMQTALTCALLLLARALLASFGFSPFASAAGAVSLLFGTTCLQYVQCAQENELLLVLALAALLSIRRWETSGAWRWAVAAGTASGFAVLVRLPSLLESAAFAAFALAGGGCRKRFLAAWLPPVAVGVMVDRWYQWLRFGDWFSTYMSILGQQRRPLGLPASFPFSYPFGKGFLGALVSPDKSVLLFDPLLVVLATVAVWQWSALDRRLRVALVSLAALLLSYDAVYASYFDFGGDVAWGHRFLTLPVQLLALFAVPLLVEARRRLPRAAVGVAWAGLAFSVGLQAVSTTMAPNVEIIQRDAGAPHSVVRNRVANLADVVTGKVDEQRFAGIPKEWRTLNYFPFQLRFRYPRLATWAIAGWWMLVACVPVLVWAVLNISRHPVVACTTREPEVSRP